MPHLDYLSGVFEVIFRLVKQAVPQAGAHDGANQQGVQQRFKQVGILPFAFVELGKQPVAEREAGYEQ